MSSFLSTRPAVSRPRPVNQLTTFLSSQNDPSCRSTSCRKTRFLGSKYHKNSVA